MNTLQLLRLGDSLWLRNWKRHPGVQVVTGDMCRWGMTLEKDDTGEEPVRLLRKPTKWMTKFTHFGKTSSSSVQWTT